MSVTAAVPASYAYVSELGLGNNMLDTRSGVLSPQLRSAV
jgi:hypothetical protein